MKFYFSSFFVLLIYTNTLAAFYPGRWNGKLIIKNTHELPFDFSLSNMDRLTGEQIMTIYNGEEEIQLKSIPAQNDSIDYVFPNFNSFLRVNKNCTKNMQGFWYNQAKGKDYKIAFVGTYLKKNENNKNIEDEFTGKWSTLFAPNKADEEPAYGIFKQKNQVLIGTFLTETGDYRYLAGKVNKNTFVLTCFDGAHAFLFTAQKINDSLFGHFYSGIHWESDWVAFKSDVSPLRNPDSITYIVENKPFSFQFKDLTGNSFVFPNKNTENKVVIVQILGTWCPNCLDESNYFKSLQEKYGKDGLEIISVAYENGSSADTRINTIKKYMETNNFQFTFLDGGCYCDKQVLNGFPMINKFSSYPTSFIVDRNGNVVSIHTGFSGPGTGKYYEEYTQKTESLIRKLIFNY